MLSKRGLTVLALVIGSPVSVGAQEPAVILDAGLIAAGLAHGRVSDHGLVVGISAGVPVGERLSASAVFRLGSFGWWRAGTDSPLEPTDGATVRGPAAFRFIGVRLGGDEGPSASPYIFVETGLGTLGDAFDAQGLSTAVGLGTRPARMPVELSIGAIWSDPQPALLATLRLGWVKTFD